MTAKPNEILPLLPIRNFVLYPQIESPLFVSRDRSVSAIEAVLQTEERHLVAVAQRNPDTENPGPEDLYTIGTKAMIRKIQHMPDATVLTLMGFERVQVISIEARSPFLKCRYYPYPFPNEGGDEIEALQRALLDQLGGIEQYSNLPVGAMQEIVSKIQDPQYQAFFVAATMSLSVEKQQSILEAKTLREVLDLLNRYLSHERQILALRRKIISSAAGEMTREQREYFLRQQLQAIQRELGECDPEKAEIEILREKLQNTLLPEAARKEAERELNHLERIPPAAPDYSLTKSYLELVTELPWKKRTEDNLDLQRARRILDEDHYDLAEVKQRIIEHLAVRKLNPEAKGPVLCFVGGPGVGKTSLGSSIARALERKFDHMSLGGLHDEAELRGHRRTYIGAMPGRILQTLRRAGVNNPLIMLDEVDKLGRDFRGDPSAALMEILDPAQNFDFRDNYLDLSFDLSHVFFITTANTLEPIPKPLLDRMEVLHIAGYSEEEKMEIAARYLVPRQLHEVGLTATQLEIAPETIGRVIRRYTREAGVRELERQIGRLTRKIAVRFAEGQSEKAGIRPEHLPDLLGPEHFFAEEARKELPPGVAIGLAWTEAGGDVLYVESALMPGQKGLILTGQLGDVMKESAQTAESYVWSRREKIGAPLERFLKNGVHVHVPAGAIPKDGPSAGVTMATALASLYSGCPVRSDTAMTGEITLSGLILPVGGIKEKILAARRSGLRRIILPKENLKDLHELPEAVLNEMTFLPVEKLDGVFQEALPTLVSKDRAPVLLHHVQNL